MELLYTRRYRINRIFSLAVSLLTTVITASVLSGLPENIRPEQNLGAVSSMAVFLFFYLFLTRKYRERKKVILTPFPDGWEDILERDVHYYSLLNSEDRHAFMKKIQIFLSEVKVTGIETEVDDRVKVLTASSAVIPVFRIPDWEYDRLSEVLIYPGDFNEEFSITEAGRDILGMVVSNTSSVIISRKALIDGFSRMDGSNTAIHEFMHKIDEEDGDIDGIPSFFLTREEQARWRVLVEEEMDKLLHAKSDFHPYALKNRAEFFAVAGEYFFEKPAMMKERHPSLYLLMQRMFRQDLASAAVIEARNMFSIRKKQTI
jgi:Mlc titration factor MtfA (ptsG expression regulator)